MPPTQIYFIDFWSIIATVINGYTLSLLFILLYLPAILKTIRLRCRHSQNIGFQYFQKRICKLS